MIALSFACRTEWDVKAIVAWRDIECGTAYCDKSYTVSNADLVSCFGYAGGAWGGGTPTEIVEQCHDPLGSPDCTIVVLEGFEFTSPINECSCIDELTNGYPNTLPPSGCCNYPYDLSFNNIWSDAGEDLIAALEACESFGTIAEDPASCTESEATWGDSCGTGVYSKAPGADFILVVDPLESYIHLTGPSDSESFAVTGGGSAKLSPSKFMTATLWAEDGTLGTHALDDWRFWIDAPANIDLSSGTFDVPASTAPTFYTRRVTK